MSQFTIPCVVYRGGTSRGLFFHEKNLPHNEEIRKRIFLKSVGSEDVSHVDGLGGGTSHTSKVVIIDKSNRPGIDILYTFVQLGIGTDTVDYEGTCGNLMAAVGAFAVDEELVHVDPSASEIVITAWSTNVHKKIRINVPLENGLAKVNGDFHISGIKSSGSKYKVDIIDPGGGKTGETLPLGKIGTESVNGISFRYSFLDIVNPFVFVTAEDFSLNGSESNDEVTRSGSVLPSLELIRELVAVKSKLAPSVELARTTYTAIPKIAYVAPPQDYMTSNGKLIRREEIDIIARMISMNKMHRTFAVSGLFNLAAACLLKGTIPYEASTLDKNINEGIVRIGHPEGIAEIHVRKKTCSDLVETVGLERTVRRLMDGRIFVPN